MKTLLKIIITLFLSMNLSFAALNILSEYSKFEPISINGNLWFVPSGAQEYHKLIKRDILEIARSKPDIQLEPNSFYYTYSNSNSNYSFLYVSERFPDNESYVYSNGKIVFCSLGYSGCGVPEYSIYLYTKKIYRCNPNESFDFFTETCQTCPEGQILDPSTGYCVDDSERPDWCPEPMIYKETPYDWKTGMSNTKHCYPNPNLTKDDCDANPNCSWDPCGDRYGPAELGGAAATCAVMYPPGYYDQDYLDYLEYQSFSDDLSFLTGGLIFPINGLGKFANGVWDSIKNFFGKDASINPTPLLDYKPLLTDMRLTPDGPVPRFDFQKLSFDDVLRNNFHNNNMGPNLPKPLPNESYSQYVTRVGLDSPTVPKLDIPQTPHRIVDVSPEMTKFDIPFDTGKLDNSAFATAKLKNDVKPMPTKEATIPNVATETKIAFDLNSLIKNDTPTTNLPMVITKVDDTPTGGAKYKGKITNPDKSVIDVDIIETKTPDGNTIQDVNFKYDYQKNDGKKGKFNTGYRITIDGSTGKVTNTTPKTSTVTDVETGTTTTNNPTNPLPTPQASPDLQSLLDSMNRVNTKLDTLNKTANKIHEQQLTEWNYRPPYDVGTALNEFKNAMNLANVSFKDGMDFLNGLKATIDDLMNQFNEMLDLFEGGIDSPDIPRGTCPFTISGPAPGSGTKNIFEIDPCRFVRPYTSILTIFFTLWLSFEVILFSLKYLFNVGGR